MLCATLNCSLPNIVNASCRCLCWESQKQRSLDIRGKGAQTCLQQSSTNQELLEKSLFDPLITTFNGSKTQSLYSLGRAAAVEKPRLQHRKAEADISYLNRHVLVTFQICATFYTEGTEMSLVVLREGKSTQCFNVSGARRGETMMRMLPPYILAIWRASSQD